MSEFSKKNKFILYFFFIFLGLLTILYQINFEDFWLDEMHSFWIADPNLMLNETILRHNKSDYHNPILFNLVLKNFLNLFGYDPEVARYLSLIFGFLLFFTVISNGEILITLDLFKFFKIVFDENLFIKKP